MDFEDKWCSETSDHHYICLSDYDNQTTCDNVPVHSSKKTEHLKPWWWISLRPWWWISLRPMVDLPEAMIYELLADEPRKESDHPLCTKSINNSNKQKRTCRVKLLFVVVWHRPTFCYTAVPPYPLPFGFKL